MVNNIFMIFNYVRNIYSFIDFIHKSIHYFNVIKSYYTNEEKSLKFIDVNTDIVFENFSTKIHYQMCTLFIVVPMISAIAILYISKKNQILCNK